MNRLFSLRFDRSLFALVTCVLNAANVYLVPQLKISYLVEFTSVVLNAVLVYLSTQVQQSIHGVPVQRMDDTKEKGR